MVDLELLHIIRSPTRASFITDDRPIDPIVVPNDAPPRATAEVSPSAIRVTLYKARWTDIENEQYNEFVDNLCRTLRAYTTPAVTSGKLHSSVDYPTIALTCRAFYRILCKLGLTR